MVRPLAVINFTFFAAAAVVLILGTASAAILIPLAVLGFFISLKSRKLRKSGYMTAICAAAIVSVIWVLLFTSAYVEPTEKLYGQKAYITGELCELPYKQNGKYYYKINTSRIEANDCIQNTTVLLSYSKKLDAEPFDTIYAAAELYTPEHDSYYYYNISRRNYLSGYIDRNETIRIYHNEGNKPLYYYALITRRKMLETIDRFLPEREASITGAILLGDKTALSSEDKEGFRTAGISHIIVVSGFHLAVITEIMVSLLSMLFFGRKRTAAFVSTVFVFMYMAVAGFTPSVVRAGIMQIILLFGKSMIRSNDSLTSLSIAAAILCFLNPYTALDIGFILSFSATLGISLWNEKMFIKVDRHFYPVYKKTEGIKKKLKKPFDTVLVMITVPLSASALTIPVVLIFFKTFSPYGIITNILVSPAVTLLIFISLFMVLTGMTGYLSLIAGLLSIPCKWLIAYILSVVEVVTNLPFSQMVLSTEFVPWCISISLVMLTFMFIIWKGKRYTLVILCIVMLISNFCAGAAFERIVKSGSVKVSVLDCGSGLTMMMSTDRDVLVLSCGGDSRKGSMIKGYLDKMGTEQIRYMLMLDKYNRCTRYAGYLLENYDVYRLHVYDEEGYSAERRLPMQNSREIFYSSSKESEIVTVRYNACDILVYKTKGCSCFYFKLANTSFLVCEGGTDCEKVPEEWHKPDYFIEGGTLENAKLIKSENIIISGYEGITNTGAVSDNTVYISGNGNYYLRVYGDNRIKKGREGYWLN